MTGSINLLRFAARLNLIEKLSDEQITYILNPGLIHTALTHSSDFLMPLLQWMQQRPTLDLAIYFKNHNGDSLLDLAAIHQPRLFPKLHQIILSMDSVTQHTILADSQLKTQHPNSLEHLLLQLNEKTLRLQRDPNRRTAFEAAEKLQTTLNQTLIDFYDKKLNAHDFKTLSNEALQAAHPELSSHWEWDMLLKNIALIILSIPMLGVPLLINYYHTGYKRLFFQNAILDTLENLSHHTEKACDHDSSSCFSV